MNLKTEKGEPIDWIEVVDAKAEFASAYETDNTYKKGIFLNDPPKMVHRSTDFIKNGEGILFR